MARPGNHEKLISRLFEMLIDECDEDGGLAFMREHGIRDMGYSRGGSGCLRDLEGRRFGRLTVESLIPFTIGKNRVRWWLCICDCGESVFVRSCALTSGNTTSCGCRSRQMSSAVACRLPRDTRGYWASWRPAQGIVTEGGDAAGGSGSAPARVEPGRAEPDAP